MLLRCAFHIVSIFGHLPLTSLAVLNGTPTITVRHGQIRALNPNDRSTVHISPLSGFIGVVIVPLQDQRHNHHSGIRIVASVAPRSQAIRGFTNYLYNAEGRLGLSVAHIFLPGKAEPAQAAEEQKLHRILAHMFHIPMLTTTYPSGIPSSQSVTVFHPDIIRTHRSGPDEYAHRHKELASQHAGDPRDARHRQHDFPPKLPESYYRSPDTTTPSSTGHHLHHSKSTDQNSQGSGGSLPSAEKDQTAQFVPAFPGSSVSRRLFLDYGPVQGRSPPEGIPPTQWNAQAHKFSIHEVQRRNRKVAERQ